MFFLLLVVGVTMYKCGAKGKITRQRNNASNYNPHFANDSDAAASDDAALLE